MTKSTGSQQPSCELCGRRDSIPCGGKGTTLVAGKDPRGHSMTYAQKCPSLIIRDFNQRTPLLIRSPFAHNSPFANMRHKNVFITAERKEVYPHLKTALWEAGPDYFFRMATDGQLLDAWLSKERSTADTDFTTLRDLVEQPELLILFLGVVSYPNKALPGVVQEALEIRSFENKPTWVITSRQKPLLEGMNLCYSRDLVYLLQENFDKVALQAAPKKATPSNASPPAQELPGTPPKKGGINDYF